jgi:hypothetical protein
MKDVKKLLDQRKQDKLPWLLDPSQTNEDNLNNVRGKVSRHFRKKQREHLKKNKINELATHYKRKNITGSYRTINEFKESFQPVTNLVKDENGDLLANSHSILNRWKNFFSQLLNVHRVSDIRQIEIQTAEPLIPERALLILKLLMQIVEV